MVWGGIGVSWVGERKGGERRLGQRNVGWCDWVGLGGWREWLGWGKGGGGMVRLWGREDVYCSEV